MRDRVQSTDRRGSDSIQKVASIAGSGAFGSVIQRLLRAAFAHGGGNGSHGSPQFLETGRAWVAGDKGHWRNVRCCIFLVDVIRSGRSLLRGAMKCLGRGCVRSLRVVLPGLGFRIVQVYILANISVGVLGKGDPRSGAFWCSAFLQNRSRLLLLSRYCWRGSCRNLVDTIWGTFMSRDRWSIHTNTRSSSRRRWSLKAICCRISCSRSSV